MIGNKTDMEERREIQTSVGREYAESVGAIFVETSAMTNKGESGVCVRRSRMTIYGF